MPPDAASNTRHLIGLNPEQRAAVSHTEGPLLILAGAGTGKTKTIVHRIAHLIRVAEVHPARILAVTFTNRAADEMRERVQDYVGPEAKRVTLSTFHSLGVRILREHGHRLGLPKKFAIYATADQLGALKTACAEISIDDNRFDLKKIQFQISDWKNRRVSPEQAKRELSEEGDGTRADAYAVLAATAYPKYEEVLRACGAVDFDDLLLLPTQLLEQDEEARRALWKRWHYVMIDEYQDTNGVQLDMARLLSGSRRNLCVVGDDDQSIYGFRGAQVGNILEFERHFPGARVIRLEQNYRSTKRILAAANAVIAANTARHEKTLRTENSVGAPIEQVEHDSEIAEAESVAREITTRRLMHKLPFGSFAVLYRANAQSRVFEEVFRNRNIPYRLVGGTSFFERKEVSDAVAYFRAIAHPDDEIALRRIINYPTRGIGRTTVLKVVEFARAENIGFARALKEVTADVIGAAALRAIQQFLLLLEDGRKELHAAEAETALNRPKEGTTPLGRWALAFLEKTGIEQEVRSDPRNAKSADARADNLKDLAGTITRYERRVWDERFEPGANPDDEEWEPPTLSGALSRLALDDRPDEEEDDRVDQHRVTLMTLHSAKGLEFSDVFLVGLEDGILPHSRSIDAPNGAESLQEERRLLYVGITRARQRLTLSYCRQRKRAGGAIDCLPSRYLTDIPQDLLNIRGSNVELPPEESKQLRQNFFANMKAMLAE